MISHCPSVSTCTSDNILTHSTSGLKFFKKVREIANFKKVREIANSKKFMKLQIKKGDIEKKVREIENPFFFCEIVIIFTWPISLLI